MYPRNDLQPALTPSQRHRRRRFMYTFFLHFLLISGLTLCFLIPSGFAYGGDPSNVPNLFSYGQINESALPTGLRTTGSCASAGYRCIDTIVYGNSEYNNVSPRRTCVGTYAYTGPRPSSVRFMAGWSSNGVGKNDMNPTFLTNVSCWTGTGWLLTSKMYTGQAVSYDGWSSTIDLKNFGSTVNNVPSGYGIGSSVAADAVFFTRNLEAPAEASGTNYLKLLTTGPLIAGEPLLFRVKWTSQQYDIWWTEFYKSVSSPQYHTSVSGNNFNLTQTGSFTFVQTYYGSGYYLPSIALGNTFCNRASSTGVYLFGGSCRFTQFNLTGSIRIQSQSEYDRSGSGASTGWSWLGGSAYSGGVLVPNSSGSIFVPTGKKNVSTWQWLGGTGSIYYGQTKAQTGVSKIVGPEGVFGVITDFKGFGPTGNAWLDLAQSLLLVVMSALLWVAQKMFNLLQLTAFFSFFFALIHPQSGLVYTIPTTILSYDLPDYLAGRTETISYIANTGNAQNVTKMIQILIVFGIFYWTAGHFLFRRKDK